jgi:tetratricopeptide (TPR) repeat protein
MVIVLTITLPSPQQQQLPDLVRVMNSSDNKQFQQILATLLSNLRDRGHIMDYVLLGDFLLRYGYPEEACGIYQLAIQQDPEHYNALIGFAVCLDELGYLDAAIAAYADATAHVEEEYQRSENRQRQGELYLRLEQVDKAQAVFESLEYVPALVKLCRIYIHQKKPEKAAAAFAQLQARDTRDESLEIYQLNVLAERHFGKPFASINPTRERELIFSDNIPLRMRKTLAEHTFRFGDRDLYGDEIRRLPVIDEASQLYSDQHILSASHNPEQIAAGEHIYQTNNCIVCHGQDAYGATGPNLRDDYWLTENISPSSMYLSIHNGRNYNTMPAYKSLLNPEQIRDVCGWLIDLHRRSERDEEGKTGTGKEPQGQRQQLIK